MILMIISKFNPKGIHMQLFLVMAYRYGTSDNTFPIGIYSNKDKALNEAVQHHQYRGGKYYHKLIQFNIDDNFKDLSDGIDRHGEWITGNFINQ